MQPEEIFFNAQHSPMGAFASFTLGFQGAKGGLGLELGKPADQNVFIGLEASDGSHFDALPFFEYTADETERFVVSNSKQSTLKKRLVPFAPELIKREYSPTRDSWFAPNLIFTVFSPVFSLPDPAIADRNELKLALVPAVLAELTLDNRDCEHTRRAFFGYQDNAPYTAMRLLSGNATNEFRAVGQGRHNMIAARQPGVEAGQDFEATKILEQQYSENLNNGLGNCGLLLLEIPASQKVTFRFSICFFRAGIVTTGIEASYYYANLFTDIEEVANFALDNFERLVLLSQPAKRLVEEARHLSDAQRFMLSHAIHSYYGSTQLLVDSNGKPLWIVNEGEYRMINTLDLTADHLFFELKLNAWTIRNTLDFYLERYSYTDKITLPEQPEEYEGGISFTHDMGMANNFSRPGYSAYEQAGLHGCFSYMTQEQLVNWVCCALVYIEQSGDQNWAEANLKTLVACFESLLNRDDPNPQKRDGIMDADTSRAKGGAEITTYDSLDTSLGQARRSTYLAGKCWAAYVGLAYFFAQRNLADLARQAQEQALLGSRTIVKASGLHGYLPALLESTSETDGVLARIIPVCEGLVFAYFSGCKESLSSTGIFGNYLEALSQHLITVLQSGICLFEDGGWKLSSTSVNSWLSKIYLNQFVVRHILGLDEVKKDTKADNAHRDWLLHPSNAYYAWSDQLYAGVVKGSRYYPRGVTSILWLVE